MGARIDRASSSDLAHLAYDHGSAPAHVAGVLLLDTTSAPGLADVRAAMAERVPAIPRFRQQLVPVPFGCGRPVWVDDPRFEIAHHVRQLPCPTPGDERALLDLVATIVTTPLPLSRPLWSATLVTGLAQGRTALVVVYHHVLADGIGGLSVLAHLVDGAFIAPVPHSPTRPLVHELFVDALGGRLRALAQPSHGVRACRSALADLAANGFAQAPQCSLNRSTGPRRAFSVLHTDLAAVHDLAHTRGATVNDVVLTAVTGALRVLLRGRGETVHELVISVPMSMRHAGAPQPGNHVGVVPVRLPVTGSALQRLDATARIMRARKSATPGASGALWDRLLRAIAAVGLFGWFARRQHFFNTSVSNVRGPGIRQSFLGTPITDIVPVTMTTGNATVGFAVLSYAGTLAVTIVADPDTCPDLPELGVQLQAELDLLTAGDDASAVHPRSRAVIDDEDPG